MKNRYQNAGFTLAELLAVVIIVALLSSLSLGYYKRSVEQSRFSEGLTAASALVEAVNRSYFDEQLEGKTPVKRPKVQSLDIALANSSASDAKPYSLFTPRFEVRIETNGNVRAYRGSADSYTYYIDIQPIFGSPKDQISCKGKDNNTFCESMGYNNCTSGVCIKTI